MEDKKKEHTVVIGRRNSGTTKRKKWEKLCYFMSSTFGQD